MDLTNFGLRLFKARGSLKYDDFTLRHDGPDRVEIIYPQRHYEAVVAIHEGTSVEAARLFKLLLITRRLA